MEDSKIVQLYWDRSPDAISQTAKKYGKYCTTIARNILGSHEDAEECVNDTYMRAWNSMPDHRPSVLSTYLGKITRNRAFNRYKREHAGKRGGSEIPAILDELSECICGRENVEQELEYKELVSTINAFLETLPIKKRNIFVCRYWYSDSVSDIAKQFGMKENAVSMVLNRLRMRLRDYLMERGVEI